MDNHSLCRRPDRAQTRRAFLVTAGRIAGGALFLPGLRSGSALARALPGPGNIPGPAGDLPTAMAELAGRLGSAVADLEKSFPYAFALYTREEMLTVRADRRTVSIDETGPREGVVLGVLDLGGLREESTPDISTQGLEKAKAALLAEPPRPGLADSPDPGAPFQASRSERGREQASTLDIRGFVDRARETLSRIQAINPCLADTLLESSAGVAERLFVNRSRRLHQVLGRGGIRATIVCTADRNSPGFLVIERGGVGGLEWTRFDGGDLERMAERATRLAGASPPDPGERTIVTEPDMTGALAHALFGHGMEIDPFAEGHARATGRLEIGQPAGSKLVRIVDDPSRPGGNGFYFFDDEGLAASPTTIVADGVFQAGLTDLLGARRTGISRTSNGRRAGYDSRTRARMSNIFFAPGTTHDPGRLIGTVTDGILVGNVIAEAADSDGPGLRLVAQYGEEIRNGRLTGRVFAPVVLSGPGADLLASIELVGSDSALAAGVCRPGAGEALPVGMGGPHLRLRARVS